jgi:hypothetical protein
MNLLEGGDQTASIRAELEAKWKDKPAEELLKAKVDSDLYIKTLEAQKDELRRDYLAQREELLAKAKFEEYIDQIKGTPKDNGTPPVVPNVNDSPKFDPDEFKKLAADTYKEFEVRKQEADNYKKVETKLKERYGDNYASALKDQGESLGLSGDEINNLAKKSPEAFFRMFGLNQSQDLFQAPPRGNLRNDNFSPRGAPTRDWNYYQEMKKTNPKLYLDPKIQVQMHNDAISLGDRFGLPSD